MIITQLAGGLGNQLFQYACGGAIVLRNGNKNGLKLDTTGYSESNGIDTARRYTLSYFNIKAKIATPEEIYRLKYPLGFISKFWRLFRFKILRQYNIEYNPKILSTKNNAYLDGYFQTEKYFKDFESEIRQDITLKNPLGKTGEQVNEQIRQTKNSISLHVRRGDYVQDAKTNQHHGSCGADYYDRAMKRMMSELTSRGSISDEAPPHIFVFSDDIEWVKENVKIPYQTTYVSSPNIPDYEELILMSQCRHHIIANSSFSWWGAWLDPRPDKIVIAPRQWVKTGQWRHKDTVVEGWIKI